MSTEAIPAGFEQAILDAISTNTVVLDSHGVIRFANKAWINFACENLGEPSKCGVGTNYLAVCDSASGEHAEGAKAMADGIRSVLAGQRDEFVIEYPCDSPSEARWFTSKTTRFEHHNTLWLFISHEEVSAHKLRDAQLVVAHAKVEANLARNNFLATMSHEIRTPLSAISGMARLIGLEDLSVGQADKLHKLKTAVRHLSATVNDVLDLAKIEANMLIIEQAPVHLEELFDTVASMLQEKIREKGLQLHLVVDPMPAGLLGDATRLSQALLNYAGNAVKFTQNGSIVLRASVAAEATDSVLLRLEVRDTGTGMTPQTIEKIFEPFVQTENTRSRDIGGTGLGLAITKKLAQAMGGDVGVDSQHGKGTTFWFTARLKKSDEPVVAASETPLRDADQALKRNYAGRRVLLAEDDDFNREIGSILLQNVGLVVDAAEDGMAAVDMAGKRAYDLILMDIQMPRLDGLEATKRIRSTHDGLALPIVALTANAFQEDRLRCLHAGMNDFLTKPMDPAALYQVILRQFERSQPVTN